MSRKRPACSGNPDLRRGLQAQAPPIEEIEAKLLSWLRPDCFKPLRLTQGEQKLRDRLLTLTVMMAVVWTEELLERLPMGGLLIFDLGFFNFLWFDAFTESGKFFVTRLRQKTAYEVMGTLLSGTLYSV